MGRSRMMRISEDLVEVIGSTKNKLDCELRKIGKDEVSLVEASKYVAIEFKEVIPEKKRKNGDWLF